MRVVYTSGHAEHEASSVRIWFAKVVLRVGGYHMGDLAANVTAWLKGLGRIGLGAERLSEPYAT